MGGRSCSSAGLDISICPISVESTGAGATAGFVWCCAAGKDAVGVIDELVAEDNDRRLRETSSCSANEDAFVEGSSEMFVVKVGDVVLEDCVIFDSSSMLESCS